MKKKLVAIAAAAVAIVPLAGSPAQASVSGKFAFQCTARLPEFPSPQATGSCGAGTAPSSATGKVAGLADDGLPYVLVAAGVNNFNATFEYQEACLAGVNEPPALGTANGTATVTGLTGTHGTTTVTASATLNFTWRRVGVHAVVTFTGGEVNFSDDHSATMMVAASSTGVATFAPVLTLANTCPVGGPLTAQVAGSATFGV